MGVHGPVQQKTWEGMVDGKVDGNVTYPYLHLKENSSAADVCMSVYMCVCGAVCKFIIYIIVICICFGFANCLNIFIKWLQLLTLQFRISSPQLNAGWWVLIILQGVLIRYHQNYHEISLDLPQNFLNICNNTSHGLDSRIMLKEILRFYQIANQQ